MGKERRRCLHPAAASPHPRSTQTPRDAGCLPGGAPHPPHRAPSPGLPPAPSRPPCRCLLPPTPASPILTPPLFASIISLSISAEGASAGLRGKLLGTFPMNHIAKPLMLTSLWQPRTKISAPARVSPCCAWLVGGSRALNRDLTVLCAWQPAFPHQLEMSGLVTARTDPLVLASPPARSSRGVGARRWQDSALPKPCAGSIVSLTASQKPGGKGKAVYNTYICVIYNIIYMIIDMYNI